jgi:hypothetical protein
MKPLWLANVPPFLVQVMTGRLQLIPPAAGVEDETALEPPHAASSAVAAANKTALMEM